MLQYATGLCSLALAFFVINPSVLAQEGTTPVGVAKIDATPTHPVVLAGYGGRTTEHEGIDTRLWSRAMVIGAEDPVAIVVLDNCGVPAQVTAKLAARLESRGIAPDRLIVAATHTHNAPNLVGYATILWAGRTTPEQVRHMVQYTGFAVDCMEKAVVAALENRRPMQLEWAQGRVTFGGNRRVLRGGTWGGFGLQRDGPVDHSLPVLAARDDKGRVRGVWANYACHCTTLGARNRVCGDWAGFANEGMETHFTEAIALMTIGCGADIGPQPSGNIDIARQHGTEIVGEVKRLLGPGAANTKLQGTPSVRRKQIQLPLEPPKPREHWESQLNAGIFHQQLAKSMLRKLDSQGRIPDTVDYPVTTWTFGDRLAMVFLPGEVVVDYSVRLNRELDWSRLWISAWANDMPGYIPSRRVLKEGGYEAEFSQVYYEQPGRYLPAVEDLLVNTITRLAGPSFKARPGQKEAPFHQLPSQEARAFRQLGQWVTGAKSEEEARILSAVRSLAAAAQPALGRLKESRGEETEWYDYAGDFAHRHFIRQQVSGTELGWQSPDLSRAGLENLVLAFTGGLGWISEPETKGFELVINGKHRVRLDVTLGASEWASDDGKVKLFYLPTWQSNVDSAGFFFLSIPSQPSSGRVDMVMRSLGKGSKRWFAIDSKPAFENRLTKLRDVLDK